MKYDSIIFDLDGTLWDSIDAILDSWNKVAKRHQGLDRKLTREDIAGIMGLQMGDIAKKLFPHLEEGARLTLLSECCNEECDDLKRCGGQLYEGVETTLSELAKQYKLFIVSNCQEGYIEAFHHYHSLDRYFLDYENAGRTGLSKGENIKLVMERNGLENPIYVGDTEGDLKGARLAGIPFIYAAYGFGEVSEYDYKIEKFSELLAL
ncbi:MAG: HAD family hydrolase [Cellulosilyticaceae bacterium]